MNKNIACYISSHGYGHAVRSAELIYNLAVQKTNWKFFIITGAPDFLFSKLLKLPNTFLRNCIVDFGLVQKDPRNFCLKETAIKLENLISDFGSVVEKERTFLKRECINAVYSDIAFIPFEAASKNNIPSIGLGNFSWDWIYYYYKPENVVFERAGRLAFSCYNKCDLYFELPGSPKPLAFNKIIKIPLICRKSIYSQNEAKKMLGIEPDKKAVLIGFSKLSLEDKAINKISKITQAQFIIPYPMELKLKNSIKINTKKIDFPTIVKASDVIITKPGYGIISDAIAANIPLLKTERGDFPEVKFLNKLVEQTVGGTDINRSDFEKGKWKKKLKKIKKNSKTIPTNGAEIASAEIIKFLDSYKK